MKKLSLTPFLGWTPLLGLVFLCFLSACSILDPYNLIGRQMGEATGVPTEVVPSPPAAALDEAARARAFDFVWNTIERHYHDPKFNGVDWKAIGERYRPLARAAPDDEAFWDTLDRMAGELRDAHTRVESPQRVALRRNEETITLGFTFAKVDGRLTVTSVSGDSDAWWAGVRPGMALVRIGAEPAQEAYDRLMAGTRFESTERARHLRVLRRIIAGDEGSKMAFAFERADGTLIEATLTRRKVSTRATESHRTLPSGFGYLRFTQWTVGVMPRALAGLETLARTPGIVIDLRGNPGGAVQAVNWMLERFFASPTELGRTTTRTGASISLLLGAVEIIKLKTEVPGSRDAYRGPVVILVNSQSASGSELFAGTMQAVGRAKVVGEPSCGCLLGFLGYARIPGGAELAYSEVGFVMANGKRIEGEGVIPDVTVPATVADLRGYRDRTLERAQELLRTIANPYQVPFSK
jgi:carboxyl-terminal processing protease